MNVVRLTACAPRRRGWAFALALVLAIASVLCVFAGCAKSDSGNAPSTLEGTQGLIFNSAHGGYEVTSYEGPETNVVIPDEYEGYPVIAIAERAFKEAEIDSVTLGKNVTVVESGAFERCKYLETVNLNAALENIDYDAFERCSKLRTVNISADSVLEEIDTCAFFKCESLESFDVPASVTYLGNGCFKDCTSLSRFTFASDWNGNIDGSCFEGCTSLESLDIPALSSLGQTPFNGLTSAQSVYIGSSLDSVKVCYSGYIYETSKFESMSGVSVYDFWFKDCDASITSA